MWKIFKKSKNKRLQKAVEKHNIRRESDIVQKVEDFRTTPCGFSYSDMIKQKFKKSNRY